MLYSKHASCAGSEYVSFEGLLLALPGERVVAYLVCIYQNLNSFFVEALQFQITFHF